MRYRQVDKAQKDSNQSGFTLVELMIASMVFAVVLLLVSATVVRFTHNFQKGVIETSTQNTARSILDTVSQALQFGGSGFSQEPKPGEPGYSPTAQKFYCMGITKYEYNLGVQVSDVSSSLVQKLGVSQSCPAGSNGLIQQELVGANMRLSNFVITGDPASGSFTVTVKIAYGDDELFLGADEDARIANARSTDPVCDPSVQLQFCAVRELSTTVQSRLE